ncbi:hypothetical protein BpHYR1_033988 [Brachionus plicatilis]|uniref:Uncharacterized protein n=1 Tax=Brachionus plicatilis TaxID=10195 RepID=A0A3M7R3T9_BRAPC|nr:hypothetical protein BpHYR1_033988 [Brachionus plicatilis]
MVHYQIINYFVFKRHVKNNCILDHDISYTLLLQPSHVNMSHKSFFRNHYKQSISRVRKIRRSFKMDIKGQKDPKGFLVLSIEFKLNQLV